MFIAAVVYMQTRDAAVQTDVSFYMPSWHMHDEAVRRAAMVQTELSEAFDQEWEKAGREMALAGVADLDEYDIPNDLTFLYLQAAHMDRKELMRALMDVIVLYTCHDVGVDNRRAFVDYIENLFPEKGGDRNFWGRVHLSFSKTVRDRVPNVAFKARNRKK